jgi:hypothetical protein
VPAPCRGLAAGARCADPACGNKTSYAARQNPYRVRGHNTAGRLIVATRQLAGQPGYVPRRWPGEKSGRRVRRGALHRSVGWRTAFLPKELARNAIVDGKTFDALVRSTQRGSSRRGVLSAVVGTLATAAFGLVGWNAVDDASAKKKKKKKKKKPAAPPPVSPPVSPPPPNPDGCPAGSYHCPGVGCLRTDQCCALNQCPVGTTCRFSDHRCVSACELCTGVSPLCCDDASESSGKSCAPAAYHCCPAAYGGGACGPNEDCCAPRVGETFGDCAWLDDGEFCCLPETGGWCFADEGCCPPALANLRNEGCCPTGIPCCNVNDDCDQVAGEACLSGCCL